MPNAAAFVKWALDASDAAATHDGKKVTAGRPCAQRRVAELRRYDETPQTWTAPVRIRCVDGDGETRYARPSSRADDTGSSAQRSSSGRRAGT